MEFKRRAARYPCGVCGLKSLTDCVKCSMCDSWFHRVCQDLSQNDFDTWSNIAMDYICVTCRTVDGTKFDYLLGIHRLQKVCFDLCTF